MHATVLCVGAPKTSGNPREARKVLTPYPLGVVIHTLSLKI